MRAIEGLSRSLTVIPAAHRTSTLKGCDKVYGSANGTIDLDSPR